MKLAGLFVFFGVLLLTLQGDSCAVCSLAEYSSPALHCTKIRERAKDIVGWQSRCTGLGDGWDLAKIDDEREYQFINQAHLADYNKHSYFIGGRTNETPAFTHRLSQNFGFNEGLFHIIATTFFGELGFLSGLGTLATALCEKPLEGEGWATAVMETTRELDFIRAAQRYFTDNRNYWIGGYTSAEHREFISPRSIDNSGPGSNRIVIVPHANKIRLRAILGAQRRPGILCERLKSLV